MRPLLTDDKEEIINISKQLGVYQTSLADYEDCCSLFEPKFPVTRPREDELIKLEQTIYWEEILNMLLQQKEFKVLG
jgi:thiamine biosynthesis protein ThiI